VKSCDQVADLVKMDRLNRLNRVVNEVAEERAQRFAGQELEVHFSLLYANAYSRLRQGVRAHQAKFGVLCLRQLITSMLAPRTAF
jgi:tRNA A37 methylthiotransferase MiaB